MAVKTEADLETELTNNFGDGGAARVAEFRALLQNIIDTMFDSSTAMDIDGLTEESGTDGSVDYFTFYDASASANRKCKVKDIPLEDIALASVYDSTTDYVLTINNDAQKSRKVNVDDFKEEYGIVINGGNTGANTKITIENIELPTWDMDTASFKSVAHGVSNWETISVIGGLIIDDAGTTGRDINQSSIGMSDTEITISSISSTNIFVTRRTGGIFDSTDFNDTSSSRGHITISYES